MFAELFCVCIPQLYGHFLQESICLHFYQHVIIHTKIDDIQLNSHLIFKEMVKGSRWANKEVHENHPQSQTNIHNTL
jgi:hypothetical protein